MAGLKFFAIISSIDSLILRRCYNEGKKMFSLLAPPVTVRGMKILDREAFNSTFKVPCLKLTPVKLSDITPTLKKYILKLKNLKPIQSNEDGTALVYLDPKKVQSFSDIDEKDRELLKNYVNHVETVELQLKYNNWQSDEILKAVLPDGLDIPTSYSKVGHLIHVNLRDNQLPYKNLIGQVFLDNIAHAKTVVNKLNTIDTTYRHFAMEILAGDDDTVATVKENGFTYQFDFAKVYWNSRLSTEHANLTNFMKKDDVLYDVFAGVGPFAIPAARKGIKVLANDLNPESYKWLKLNAATNKVKNIETFNKDGRDFLRHEVKNHIIDRRDCKTSGNEHIAMNLPALASEFLDVLDNWFNENDSKRVCANPPLIHLYCFVKTDKSQDDPSELAKALVEDKIGCTLGPESLKNIHFVRNVSPNKEMMRVSFYLTENMINAGEPARKKTKINDCSVKNENIVGHDGKEQEKCQDEKCIQSRC